MISTRIRNFTTTVSSPAQWLIDWVRGGDSDSGVRVGVDESLGYAPVWYAVSKIAGDVGKLTLNLHRRLDRGSEVDSDNQVHRLLNFKPNEFQTPIVFRENLMLHALLMGNGRAVIMRDNRGTPTELIPLLPHLTLTCLAENRKWHVVTAGDDDRCGYVAGSNMYRDGKVYKIPDKDVLHIPGLGYNGFAGRNVIESAKQLLGLGLAAEKASSASFRNPKPGIVIEAPRGTFRNEEDAKEFLKNFNNFHVGVDNAGRAALMRENMKIHMLGISAQDAQWIEQRKFQRQEVALLFGLESIMGDEESNSYNSREHKTLDYISNTLQKWLKRWEQECDLKLLGPTTSKRYYFAFDTLQMVRGDLASTVTALGNAIQHRILSPNEARVRWLNLNPYEGGDSYENPAITPGNGQPEENDDSESESDTEDDTESTEATESENKRNKYICRHLFGREAARVKDLAKKVDTFCDTVEEFYDKWAATMTKVLGGGDHEAYCKKQFARCLEIAGSVTDGEQLLQAVASAFDSWRDISDQYAQGINTNETQSN